MMIYGYIRVSTRGQERDGNSVESQMSALKQAGCEQIFHDAYTGTKMDRPEFTKLIGLLKSGDRLVVTKLDRLARTVVGGADLVRKLMDDGIAVHVLNMGMLDNTPIGRLLASVMFAFAEFERDMIIERTNEGKRVRREHDPKYREGRKQKKVDERLFAELYEKSLSGEETVYSCCKRLGISKSTWYNRVRNIA